MEALWFFKASLKLCLFKDVCGWVHSVSFEGREQRKSRVIIRPDGTNGTVRLSGSEHSEQLVQERWLKA